MLGTGHWPFARCQAPLAASPIVADCSDLILQDQGLLPRGRASEPGLERQSSAKGITQDNGSANKRQCLPGICAAKAIWDIR